MQLCDQQWSTESSWGLHYTLFTVPLLRQRSLLTFPFPFISPKDFTSAVTSAEYESHPLQGTFPSASTYAPDPTRQHLFLTRSFLVPLHFSASVEDHTSSSSCLGWQSFSPSFQSCPSLPIDCPCQVSLGLCVARPRHPHFSTLVAAFGSVCSWSSGAASLQWSLLPALAASLHAVPTSQCHRASRLSPAPSPAPPGECLLSPLSW